MTAAIPAAAPPPAAPFAEGGEPMVVPGFGEQLTAAVSSPPGRDGGGLGANGDGDAGPEGDAAASALPDSDPPQGAGLAGEPTEGAVLQLLTPALAEPLVTSATLLATTAAAGPGGPQATTVVAPTLSTTAPTAASAPTATAPDQRSPRKLGRPRLPCRRVRWRPRVLSKAAAAPVSRPRAPVRAPDRVRPYPPPSWPRPAWRVVDSVLVREVRRALRRTPLRSSRRWRHLARDVRRSSRPAPRRLNALPRHRVGVPGRVVCPPWGLSAPLVRLRRARWVPLHRARWVRLHRAMSARLRRARWAQLRRARWARLRRNAQRTWSASSEMCPRPKSQTPDCPSPARPQRSPRPRREPQCRQRHLP